MNDRAAMRKVIEYMAIGKPVVQFPLTEMRRLCGSAAVYARDADADDMAERVCELLDDPERRRALGDAARRRAADGLMWSAQEPALAAAVDAALAGAARRRRRGSADPHVPFHACHPAQEEAP
jgi:glycosyltransferase involved in cell wall biosynthesis